VNYGYSGMRSCATRAPWWRAGILVAFVSSWRIRTRSSRQCGRCGQPAHTWRYDPKLAGISSIVADCGIHALHMACYITGQEVRSLSADFATTVQVGDWKTMR